MLLHELTGIKKYYNLNWYEPKKEKYSFIGPADPRIPF